MSAMASGQYFCPQCRRVRFLYPSFPSLAAAHWPQRHEAFEVVSAILKLVEPHALLNNATASQAVPAKEAAFAADRKPCPPGAPPRKTTGSKCRAITAGSPEW